MLGMFGHVSLGVCCWPSVREVHRGDRGGWLDGQVWARAALWFWGYLWLIRRGWWSVRRSTFVGHHLECRRCGRSRQRALDHERAWWTLNLESLEVEDATIYPEPDRHFYELSPASASTTHPCFVPLMIGRASGKSPESRTLLIIPS